MSVPLSAPSLVHQLFDLLANHCTSKDGGQRKFVEKVNSILEMSTLDSKKDIDTVWCQTWDKPLYADQFAQVASDLIDGLRAMTPAPLNDFRCLPSEPHLLKGLKRYTLKHQRLLTLGAAWNLVFERHIAAAKLIEARQQTHQPTELTSFAREVIGIPGYGGVGEKPLFFDAVTALTGFGKITALHISTDLGYPVYKPDRWVLRFAATDPSVRLALENRLPVGMTLDRLTPRYLERHVELVLFAVDHLTEAFAGAPQPREIVDLRLGFRRHRFVDLMIVKFGMKPERQFGIEISGMDLLLRSPDLAKRYPQLFVIAQEMDKVIKEKRDAKRAKRRAKSSV